MGSIIFPTLDMLVLKLQFGFIEEKEFKRIVNYHKRDKELFFKLLPYFSLTF